MHAVLLVVLVYTVLIGMYGRLRVIDGDEGYYASAARLVSEGHVPYLDFFYPQAPILPFVYGAWAKFAGYSLASLRILSTLLAAIAVGLWAWFLFEEYDLLIALTTFLVLLLNPFLLSWSVVVKTFALANLFATLTLISLWRAGVTHRPVWMFAAGVSSGLVVSTRLLYAAIPLVIVFWLSFRRQSTPVIARRSSLMAFISGTVLALIPALYLFIRDPDVFVFNNIGYHLLRSDNPSAMLHAQQAGSYLVDTFSAHGYLLLVIVFVVVGACVVIFQKKENRTHNFPLLEIALLSTIVLLITSLIPIPLYEQYFTAPLAPLALPLVAAGVAQLGRWRRVTVFVALPAVILLSAVEVQHDQRTQAYLLGAWRLAVFDSVSTYIRNHTVDSDTVLSPWPGYACESSRQFMPGFENQFGLPVAERLTNAERRHYRLAGKDSFISAVGRSGPRLVIIGAFVGPLFAEHGEGDRGGLYRALDEGYTLATEIEGVFIYERKTGQR